MGKKRNSLVFFLIFILIFADVYAISHVMHPWDKPSKSQDAIYGSDATGDNFFRFENSIVKTFSGSKSQL